MGLEHAWPLFGLRLRTPRLELRIVRDTDLDGLVSAVDAGVHPPEQMPFAQPWTDAAPDERRRGYVRHVWERRAVTPERWLLAFAVVLDGEPIGVQDLSATDFAVRGTVDTGSWLTRARHGRGIGTEMRAAVLLLAFDHLGAEVAESAATSWNAASLGVSRRLGYRENGRSFSTGRPGERVEELQVRLLRDEFVRPAWQLQVDGLEAARRELLGD